MEEIKNRKPEIKSRKPGRGFFHQVALLVIVLMPVVSAAQGTSPPPAVAVSTGEEMITDQTSGELTVTLPNYWDGVDSEDDLHVPVSTGPVLNDVGQMIEMPAPSYPNFVDMNGDGLKDLVVADTQGFVWIFTNSGEKGKPKFTTGKFIPTFIGWGSKIHVCDWDGDGDNDIVIGTFYGDVVVMYNFGSRVEWRFTRKMAVPRYMDSRFLADDPRDRLPQIMMGKEVMIKGNNLSPWVADWNKDGKPDLLLGEGTYSANSIRLFVNTGSRTKPTFSEEREFYLAYGEGFEQLTPCVVDYNGDGVDDLIVGTRTGQIRLHKGTKAAVEMKDFLAAMKGTLNPAILEYEGDLEIGGKKIFDQMTTLYPCDWNEDGLFDLLLGSTKGKVYIAMNKGTKTAPSFPEAEPVKGTDEEKDLLAPNSWFNGIARIYFLNNMGIFCNSALLLSCETGIVLKAGTVPIKPVVGDYFFYYRYVHNYQGWTINLLCYLGSIPALGAEYITGGRVMAPKQTFNLEIGKKYELSFYSILEGKPALWRFWIMETIVEGTDFEPPVKEWQEVNGAIPPSITWVKRNYTFKCPSKVESNRAYQLFFRMSEGDGKLLLDGLSLKKLE